MNETDSFLERGEEYYREAEKYHQKGAYSTSLQYIERAEQMFTTLNDSRWLTRGRHQKMQTLKDMGRYIEALELFANIAKEYRAAKDTEGLIRLLIHRSEIFSAQEQHPECLGSLRIAETITESERVDTLRPRVYFALSSALFRLRDIHHSIQYARKALQYYEPETDAWNKVHESLSDSYRVIFSFEKAQHHLNQVFDTYSRQNNYQAASLIIKRLSQMYEERGQSQKAEDLKQKMLRINKMNLTPRTPERPHKRLRKRTRR